MMNHMYLVILMSWVNLVHVAILMNMVNLEILVNLAILVDSGGSGVSVHFFGADSRGERE